MFKCPRCNAITSSAPHNKDFVHECGKARPESPLGQEDILKIGNYTDEDTGTTTQVSNPNYQGLQNKASIVSKIQGIDVEQLTDRGKRVSTHRSRNFKQFIEIK